MMIPRALETVDEPGNRVEQKPAVVSPFGFLVLFAQRARLVDEGFQ